MNAKEIDVCICFYNTPLNYFKECLNSIINQTNKNFNLILLNDGSTNIDIEEYLNNEILNKNFGFDVFYRKQRNKQLFFSRIEILKFTVSEYVYFFDSDDILKSDAINNMINSINNNEFGCKPDIISFESDCIKNGKITNNFIKSDYYGLITNAENDYNILNFFFNNYNGWNRVMWNKIFKASLLKKIYFKIYTNLSEKNSFFAREDIVHNTLIFMCANSFLDIGINIITYRLDDDRHQEQDNKKRVIFQINYFNNLIKIIRNKEMIKDKSDEYKKILYEKLYKYIDQEIVVCNYLINRYNLKDYVKSYIYNTKNIDIDSSIRYDNGKLIFEDKNIL